MEAATIEMVDRRGGDDRREGDRRRGRPSVLEGTKSASAATTLPVPIYDRLARLALFRRVTISELLRTAATEYVTREEVRPPSANDRT
jgi:hypothetical protein